jgi:hypothetical protein
VPGTGGEPGGPGQRERDEAHVHARRAAQDDGGEEGGQRQDGRAQGRSLTARIVQ